MTQRPGWMGRISAMCSGSPGFDSCSRYRSSQLRTRDSPQSLQEIITDRFLSSPHIYLRKQRKNIKHIYAPEESDASNVNLSKTKLRTPENCLCTSSCRICTAAITWSWNLNVQYVTHYGKHLLIKGSEVLQSIVHKYSNTRLSERTTKTPYVNRHGIS